MYLVVIGWLYVVVMMAAAEATHSDGSLLGAIFTFFLYGLMPVALLLYLTKNMGKRRRPAPADPIETGPSPDSDSASAAAPDDSSHAAGAAEPTSVTAVRKEQ